jgi:hypothetical protein
MGEPTRQTIKKLFALSGNLCAYPSCSLPMVESSGTVTGQICHIHAQNEGGPRFTNSLSEKELHAFENLILMCGHHHKVIDAEEHIYTAKSLRELKQIHEEATGRAERSEDAFYAQLLLNAHRAISVGSNTGNLAINSPGAIQGNTVTINTTKKSVNIQAPMGTIGASVVLSKYISHLIKRYNEFASKEPSRKSKFSYGAISKNISDKFGSKWQLLEEDLANEVISYMHSRILRTRQARINKGKGYPSFSTLEEYQEKYGAKGI